MKKLSVCVTVKNRSKVESPNGLLYLFPNMIKSLATSINLSYETELIISDWKSTDWVIRDWIQDYIKHIPINLITIHRSEFSIGYGRNIAGKAATGDILFFVDADMIIEKNVVDYGIQHVNDTTVYYPTVRYTTENKNMLHEGGGNLFITKNLFEQTSGWPVYHAHGFEDTDFHNIIKNKANIITSNVGELVHQWHPQSFEFKNKYSTPEGVKFIQEKRIEIQSEKDELLKSIRTQLDTPNIRMPIARPSRLRQGANFSKRLT